MKTVSKMLSALLFCAAVTACSPEAKSANVNTGMFKYHIKCWNGVNLTIDEDVITAYYVDYGYGYVTQDNKHHHTNMMCIIDEL